MVINNYIVNKIFRVRVLNLFRKFFIDVLNKFIYFFLCLNIFVLIIRNNIKFIK